MRKARIIVLLLVALAVPVGLSSLIAANEEPKAAEDKAAKPHDLPFKKVRVAVLTGEGFQDAETMMPMAFLANRGATVTVIGLRPEKVTAYNSSIQLYLQKSVADVDAQDFDILILPGGHAPAQLRQDEKVLKFTREFFASGQPIAAICHGPQVLVTAGVVESRTLTCYSGMVDELRNAGAKYKDETVVHDGNLITSRTPVDIPAWLSTIEHSLQEQLAK